MTDSVPMSHDLADRPVDHRARFYRAIADLCPGGSFVSEYLIESIPGQRLERVIAFVQELEKRLKTLERTISPDDKYVADLVEDGILQSSRALSETRAQYLARAVVPYDPKDKDEWETRKKILQIIRELTDRDIEVLRLHEDATTTVQSATWANWPGDQLTLAERQQLSDEELFRREAKLTLLDLHFDTLVRFNLLAPVRRKPQKSFRIDRSGSTPIVSNAHLDEDGNPEIERYRVTATGRLLLSCVDGRYSRNGP